MNAEAPVRDDVSAERVARAHGWLRTGARIREQIALHLRAFDRTEETSGTFLWKPAQSRRAYLSGDRIVLTIAGIGRNLHIRTCRFRCLISERTR